MPENSEKQMKWKRKPPLRTKERGWSFFRHPIPPLWISCASLLYVWFVRRNNHTFGWELQRSPLGSPTVCALSNKIKIINFTHRPFNVTSITDGTEWLFFLYDCNLLQHVTLWAISRCVGSYYCYELAHIWMTYLLFTDFIIVVRASCILSIPSFWSSLY